jgi:ABC-type glycerol-3-phosphate transport system substrate-binding protein
MDLVAWVELGIIQPVEQFFAASKAEGAANFLKDMLPPVREDAVYDGKMYTIPYGVENITYQWRKDLFGDVGVAGAPKSWQNLIDQCAKLRDAIRAKGDTKTFPIAFDLHLARSAGALICSATHKPYTSDGLINWDSAEMRECLKFMRRCSREGLTPPNCGVGAEVVDMWLRGRAASLYSTSSRGVFAQKSLGFDKVTTSQIPTIDGTPKSGTTFWGDGMTVLMNAPRGQEAIDFFVWAFGPQNADWQKGVAKSGLAPVFNSAYTDVLDKDPEMEPYRWMSEVRDAVAISVPAPKNYMYPIQVEAWNKWHPEYLKDNSTMTEDELIQKVLKTTEDMRVTVLTSVPKK